MKYLIPVFCLFFIFPACKNNTSSDGNDEKIDSTHQIIGKDVKSPIKNITEDENTEFIIGTFKNINAYEGIISLLFLDEAGEEIYFTHFDCDIDEFFTAKESEKDKLTDHKVVAEKIGIQFKITYQKEIVIGEFSGEEHKVKMVKIIEEIN